MKTMLIAINCKYIHPNMAVRSLKANNSYEIDYLEFTIKDDIEKITNQINQLDDYDIIGFSTYIWNIEIFKQIIPKIKNKIIFMGGPEVSYDVLYFFSIFDNLDFIISAEGETALEQLLFELHNDKKFENVQNLSFKKDGKVIQNKILEENLSVLKTNYQNIEKSQYVYFETSRGCAFKCSYCLSSLEISVRYFDEQSIKEELYRLMNEGYLIFKFMDRTFNLDSKKALDLLEFIDEFAKKNNVFEFEIAAEILSDELLEFLNKRRKDYILRFEIGIQSTNNEVVKAVKRFANQEKLFKNIKYIQDNDLAVLHLDLIAGLPHEDLESFKNTLNETLELEPLELQLGFLKLLRGTSLRRNEKLYGYKCHETAPYEIISNNFMSEEDILTIKRVEQVIEKYYNVGYFYRSFKDILKSAINSFDFLDDFAKFFENKNNWFDYDLAKLFSILDEYMKERENYSKIHFELVYDYLRYAKIRPKRWYLLNIEKSEKTNVLNGFYEKHQFYQKNELYKYSQVVKFDDKFIIKMFLPDDSSIFALDHSFNILSKH